MGNDVFDYKADVLRQLAARAIESIHARRSDAFKATTPHESDCSDEECRDAKPHTCRQVGTMCARKCARMNV